MKRLWLLGFSFGLAVVATASLGSPVTFYKDVLPILQEHCQSCHRPGQLGPMSFLSYKEVRPWAESIKYVVVAGKMPPSFAASNYPPVAVHRALKPAEMQTIIRWVDGGALAGDPKDAPPPVYYEDRWAD